MAKGWLALTLAALSCSFPGYNVSSDPDTSGGGSAAAGRPTDSPASTTGSPTAGMGHGGAAAGGAPVGTAGLGGTSPEPTPAGGSGGAAAVGGTAGSNNQAGGGMAGVAGAGGAVTAKVCADFDDLPPDCLCRDHSGHAYFFCSGTYAWSQSDSRCGFYQTSLAKIETPGEDLWILKQAHGISDPRPLTFFWIGASSVDSPGTWHWPDGAIFWRGDAKGNGVGGSYFNWRVSNPQNTTGTACVFADDNGWEEGDCSFRRGYVCEAQ